MRILTIVLGLFLSAQAGQEIVRLCHGFAPPNNRRIPVARPGFMQVGGITEAEFNDMLSRIETVMSGDVAERGGKLVIHRYWQSEEVNAYADRNGDEYLLEMHGGLARHPLMTPEAYVTIACHELGHHIGGAPHFAYFGDSMSNEGQSDYFASLKCFRRLFTLEENQAWAATAQIHPLAESECNLRHTTEAEQLSCKRVVMAGIVLGNVLADLGSGSVPTLGDFDPTEVTYTDDSHPMAQCRLDTYFNGAVCDRSTKERVSDTDYRSGSCEKEDGYDYGFRPRCWFSPNGSRSIEDIIFPVLGKN